MLLFRYLFNFGLTFTHMDTPSYFPVPPGVGMEDNFLSLDDILLSQERLPVRTECVFPRLGFLEKSSDSQDIQEVGWVCCNKLQ